MAFKKPEEYTYEDLTVKQRKLIDALLEGKSNYEAFDYAYPNNHYKDNASKSKKVNYMISNRSGDFTKFAIVYKQMKEEVKEKAIISAEEVIQFNADGLRGNVTEEVAALDPKTGKFVISSKQISHRDRKSCADSLARYLGISKEQIRL